MSLTERIYGKETAGKPAVSSDTQKNLYTAAANKKPSLANRIAQNGGQPTLYADAAAKQKPSLAGRIEAKRRDTIRRRGGADEERECGEGHERRFQQRVRKGG